MKYPKSQAYANINSLKIAIDNDNINSVIRYREMLNEAVDEYLYEMHVRNKPMNIPEHLKNYPIVSTNNEIEVYLEGNKYRVVFDPATNHSEVFCLEGGSRINHTRKVVLNQVKGMMEAFGKSKCDFAGEKENTPEPKENFSMDKFEAYISEIFTDKIEDSNVRKVTAYICEDGEWKCLEESKTFAKWVTEKHGENKCYKTGKQCDCTGLCRESY